jgi:hypothetical protein
LNDVALCVLDEAMHRYLRERGQTPDRPLVAICPVSLRDDTAHEATTNVSAIWPSLGPVTRASTSGCRRSWRAPALPRPS